MGNIYVGWVSVSDPPSPWTRLTRQGKYIRATDNYANHLVSVGSSTHNHNGIGSAFSCGYDPKYKTDTWDPMTWAMYVHQHGAPSGWSTGNGSNAPPYYTIDLIYMDADDWTNTERTFPIGTLIISYGSISATGLTRHTASDGYFLYNNAPGSTGGSSATHNHTVSGTLANSGTSGHSTHESGSWTASAVSHNHTVSTTSSSSYPEPAHIQTRLYEVTDVMSSTQRYTVAFFSSTPPSEWSVLTSWAGKLIKGGNVNPTTGGSDTHNHTISATSSVYTATSQIESGDDEGVSDTYKTHSHAVTDTIANGSTIPPSVQLIPAYITVTIYRSSAARPQLIGLSSW